MKSLRQLLDGISPKDRALLQYAFENGKTQIVMVEDSQQFLGVNIPKGNPIYEISQEAGSWSSGTLKKSEK